MTSPKKQRDHNSDIQNANRGTPGTNTTWDHAQGNRGKQLNPNQQPAAREGGKGANTPPQGAKRR